ncbi:hypothetical protein JB92DRAFT_1560172 [Gautieria morchelliformis]|nr:hypothetical protein JB92DRAFT_1560172 [Gautieria morchelliformis]
MLVYDYAITFDMEVEFVWMRTWGFGKAIFLIATLVYRRFFPLYSDLCQVPCHSSCQNYIWWQITSTLVSIITAEVILIMRIHAVYDCNKKLLILMVALLLVEVIIAVVLSAPTLQGAQSSPHIIVTSSTGCPNYTLSSRAFISWIPAILFETFLMFLMLRKGWGIYKSGRSAKLLHLIIRDSLVYYLAMVMTLVANCCIWALSTRRHLSADILPSLACAMPCVLGSRLLLNMRERFFKETTVDLSPEEY